jgi:HlyD family secretion protein
MGRRSLILIGVVLLVAGAGVAYALLGSLRPAPGYRYAEVERGTITAAVSATGTLTPVVSVQVGSQISGQIKELYADYNSPVKKGQLIAQIDPDSIALRVNQAMADLEAARATVLTQRANVAALQAEVSRAKVSLADANRELERNRMLAEKNFISTAVLDKSQATFDAAQEQVKIAQAQLRVAEAQVHNVEALVKQRDAQLAQAKVDLSRTSIRAPVDGIVVKKSVEPGQTVAASLQAPELFVIAQDLREMQVETSIDEAEVGRIRVGQSATFTVDSFPGRTFRGTVSQVRKAAQVVQNVVTYIAVITTSNSDLSLFPGMTANVRIVVDTRKDVLKMPNAALRFRPPGASSEPREPVRAAFAEEEKKGAAKGRGGQAARERLTKELGLSTEQQAKVEAILNETRDRIRTLGTEDQNARRKQVERLRAESRTRIAELLTPEQRVRYEAMAASRATGGAASGRVWVTDAAGELKPVEVRLGLSDGSHTELLAGELGDGGRVVVGMASADKSKPTKSGGPRFGF